MRKSLWVIVLLFVAVGAPNAHAGSVKWTFSSASATFSDPYPPGTDTITGSFIFNSATMSLSNASITLTGPVFAGTYTEAGPTSISCLCLAIGNFGPDSVGIVFSELFTSSSPVPLLDITISNGSTTLAYTQTNYCPGCVTGTAVPTSVAATPEPSSLFLFGTSLLGLVPFRR